MATQYDPRKALTITVAEMIAAHKEHSAVEKAEGNLLVLSDAVDLVAEAGYNRRSTLYFVQTALNFYNEKHGLEFIQIGEA